LLKNFRSLLPEYFPDTEEEATEEEDESHTGLSQTLEEATIDNTPVEGEKQEKTVEKE
jgi:hypothetical protein